MIDNIFNLVFRCRHARLTRPVTPIDAAGVPQGDAYVVCLDCGMQFSYDAREMRMGKAIRKRAKTSEESPRRGLRKVLPWLFVPIGLLIGTVARSKRKD
jgi:hypothetical protein